MTVWVASLGLSIGLVLGGLGGGAILTVPTLVYLLGQSPQAATTESLIIVGLTSLVGLAPHARAGRVRFTKGLTFGVLGVFGSVVGARASASVPSRVLMSAFSVLLLVVAGLRMRTRRTPAEATAMTRVATPAYAGAGACSQASESPSRRSP